MRYRCRLCEVKEIFAGQDLTDLADDILETDDMQLVINSWYVIIDSLQVSLRTGISCIWDEAQGMYLPDSRVTVVYEGALAAGEWIAYEQEGVAVTLGDWLDGRLSCEQIEQLWCELIIPEQNKIRKEGED